MAQIETYVESLMLERHRPHSPTQAVVTVDKLREKLLQARKSLQGSGSTIEDPPEEVAGHEGA